jgi:hypothetical protein
MLLESWREGARQKRIKASMGSKHQPQVHPASGPIGKGKSERVSKRIQEDPLWLLQYEAPTAPEKFAFCTEGQDDAEIYKIRKCHECCHLSKTDGMQVVFGDL